jgi:septum formation protein
MRKDFVYLASASPRRSELLRQIGVRFVVRPAHIPETRAPGETPSAYVGRIAAAKAGAVSTGLGDAERAPVLAADTAVVLDGRVLGKPADPAEAAAMIAELSGRTHVVLTAVALHCGDGAEALLNRSEVRFRATTAEERGAYSNTAEPYDKAGGYAIQGRAALFVEHLSGSYSGVMGLPLFETGTLLARCGIVVWPEASLRPGAAGHSRDVSSARGLS